MEYTAQVRGLGALALSQQQLSLTLRDNIKSTSERLKDRKAQMLDNIDKAMAKDDLLKASLSAADQSFERQLSDALALTEREITNKTELTLPADQYFHEFSKANEEMASYTQKLLTEISRHFDQRLAQTTEQFWQLMIALGLLIAVLLVFGYLVLRHVLTSIRAAVVMANAIAKGDLSIEVTTKSRDEIGTLMQALTDMQAVLKSNLVVAAENFRVRQALDGSSTCFMIADADRNIVYTNNSVIQMLKKAEDDIRAAIPSFNVDELMGKNIDVFHKNPAHQRNLLAKLSGGHTSQIKVGRLTFRLILNPILDLEKKVVGTVVEWQDLTDVVAAELQTRRILESLNSTTTNVMIADADRKIIYLNKSVHSMLKESEADLRKVLPHFNADQILNNSMDVFHKNPAHQMGLLASLSSTHSTQIQVGRRRFRLIANPIFANDGTRLGTVVEWLDRTAEVEAEQEVEQLVQAASKGDFSARLNTEGKTGFLLNLATGLNSLMGTAETGLADVSRVLRAIAKADLTESIENNYDGIFAELARYCNETSTNLAQMIGEIRSAADLIYTASSEIAQGNADLSSRTESQASSLEETAASMEQLTSTVQLNADNARQANQLATQASTVAVQGGSLIEEVVVTMTAINDSASKIADIIGVIDGIAFQTNILALNAAVEAARAGDQGRGFAVVASEVRSLAQRSANAAKDIKALISDSVQKIESGNGLVGKSGQTMQEIVTAIRRVNDIMAEIASASSEQAQGIQEISQAVTRMDDMTQQNAALVEEAAAAAESMRTQADQLTRQVGTFKLSGEQQLQRRETPVMTPRLASQPKVKSKAPPKALPPVDDEWEQF